MKSHQLLRRLIFPVIASAMTLTVSATPKHTIESEARFVKSYSVGKRLAVVAEGDDEPRSIGSYTVRLYADKTHDWFIAGLVRPRDGFIEKVVLTDVTGDRQPEIVVIVRNVGTGGFLSADAFAVKGKSLSLIASVTDLDNAADPIVALKKAKTR